MFLTGNPPELSLKTLNDSLSEIVLRGDVEPVIPPMQEGMGDNKVDVLTQKGIDYDRKDKDDEAIKAYREAITLAVLPMNHLAWLYQKQNNLEQALPLAQVAVMMNPEKPEFIHTVAVILCKIGEHSEAVDYMKKAARLNPRDFNWRLEKFKQGLCQE
jgi:tetratricopeptide (TPR) repeat protein